MYEELIERLRNKADTLSYFNNAEDYRAAADAIEDLTRKVEILEKQIDDGVEAAKQAIAGIERYACQIQEKVNSLDDHQHYSGRYIKSIMGVEEWEK